MSGRGENNKRGSAGRGTSNKSNQPFKSDGKKQPESNHKKQHTRGEASVQQEKISDTDMDRNSGIAREKIHPLRADERSFELLVDDVPYFIKATPFSFNGETRFYIKINGGTDHVFTWDSELGQLRAIDDNASTLPLVLEEAISQRLQRR